MNWYRKATGPLSDFFSADLTEEQTAKKSLLRDVLGIGTGAIIAKTRRQRGVSLGEAIDIIYDRLEEGKSAVSCKDCRWYKTHNSYEPPSCKNTNWTGRMHDIDQAPCGGISWDQDELVS